MPTKVTNPLAEILDAHTKEGELYEKLPDNRLTCYACGHRCVILDGLRGICQVRYNRGGTLYVPSGYVCGLQPDPTEKKPLFHVMPGSIALTFGMLGCDYHCPYCQNWLSSQTLRDPAAGSSATAISAEEMVAAARRTGARLIASSYNEPLITAEWAVEIFRPAKEAGFRTAFISNGNATREVLDFLRPWTDCYKIDLKSMSKKNYRSLGGTLENVLNTIGMVAEMGFWVEVVTLVVPGWNDSDKELREAARFLASISPSIPWHVTAFHKDYRMTGPDNTSTETLMRAAEAGREAGLRYVYGGNLPGGVGRLENTYCHNCGELLVERYGYRIAQYRLKPGGRCPSCSALIPGVWE